MVGTGSKAHAVSTAWRLNSLQLPSCIRERSGMRPAIAVLHARPGPPAHHDGAVMGERALHYTTLILAPAGFMISGARDTLPSERRLRRTGASLSARHQGTAGGVLAGVEPIPGAKEQP